METLELPSGDVVTPEEPFLYEGYPYRFRPRDDEYAFELAPLYWGDSDMDVPMPDRQALVEQWGRESRGALTAGEWEQWLAEAREDHRFDDAEVDALARGLPVDDGAVTDDEDGVLARLQRALWW